MKSVAEKSQESDSRSVAESSSFNSGEPSQLMGQIRFTDHRGLKDNNSNSSSSGISQLHTSSKVVQRDAFWSVDPNNKVQNTTPAGAAPAFPYIKRVGGSQNHEVHNSMSKARGAARAEAKIKLSKSTTRNDTSGPQAAGSYQYDVPEASLNVNADTGVHALPSDTNSVINHTQDNQAELELHTGAGASNKIDTINHFHAYEYNQGANIRSPFSTAAQPRGDTRLGAEHYFVNPF